MRATQAIIHLDRLIRNLHFIRNLTGTAICAPVKADAYGHGAVPVARTLLAAGAGCLGVATVPEGASLRKAGIDAPILLFSMPDPREIPLVLRYQLSPFVSDCEGIRLLAEAARRSHTTVQVHLKIDTGMGRIGCRPESAVECAQNIADSPSLTYAGTATHFAVSDSTDPADKEFTKMQLERFCGAVALIRNAGIDPGILHTANSGAVLQYPESYFDMIRPGILLYGYAPDPALARMAPVAPVMEVRTRISFVKSLHKGESVSYGRTWVAPGQTSIATLPIGYGDALPRLVSGKFRVLIRDRLYPLVGRICMDQCMVDLGRDSGITRGEPVSIFGHPESLNAADIAASIGTIPYEITCNINKRVPRVYRKSPLGQTLGPEQKHLPQTKEFPGQPKS
ncbi:alanine racemase [Spirochaetia bacterium]|nr:alanine racemase [Spirochaetia bacterium]